MQVEALKKKDPAVLGVFKDEKSSDFKVFSKTADKLADDFEFGHTFDADLVEGVSKAPALIIYKHSEDKTLVYDGKFKAKDLEAWIETKALPLLPELDQSVPHPPAPCALFAQAMPGGLTRSVLPAVAPGTRRRSTRRSSRPSPRSSASSPRCAAALQFLAMQASSPAGADSPRRMQADKKHDEFVQQLTAAAEERQGEVFFITVDPAGNPQALSYFGIKDSDAPAYVIQDGNDKYIAKNAAPGDLAAFLKNFKVSCLL